MRIVILFLFALALVGCEKEPQIFIATADDNGFHATVDGEAVSFTSTGFLNGVPNYYYFSDDDGKFGDDFGHREGPAGLNAGRADADRQRVMWINLADDRLHARDFPFTYPADLQPNSKSTIANGISMLCAAKKPATPPNFASVSSFATYGSITGLESSW